MKKIGKIITLFNNKLVVFYISYPNFPKAFGVSAERSSANEHRMRELMELEVWGGSEPPSGVRAEPRKLKS